MPKIRIYFSLVFVYSLIYWLMVYLSWLTPMMADDYPYWPYWFHYPEKIFDLKEIINFQIAHWHIQNGRIISHTLDQILLLSTDWLRIFISPMVFCLMISTGIYLVWGNKLKNVHNLLMPLFVFTSLWLYTPQFGFDYLFISGTANYLYPTFIFLIFLIPFRKLFDNFNYNLNSLFILPWCLLALCAGWSNENLGIVGFALSASVWIFVFKKTGKINIWLLAGSILSLCGWLLLMLAPGQQARISMDAPGYLGAGVTAHILKFLQWWCERQFEFLPLTAICLLGIWANRGGEKTRPSISALIFFVMAQATILAFVFSPVFASHALACTVVFLSLSSIYYLFSTPLFYKIVNYSIIGLIITYGILSIYEKGLIYFWQQHKITQKREYLLTNFKNPDLPAYKNTGNKWFIAEATDYEYPALKPFIYRYYNINGYRIIKDKERHE